VFKKEEERKIALKEKTLSELMKERYKKKKNPKKKKVSEKDSEKVYKEVREDLSKSKKLTENSACLENIESLTLNVEENTEIRKQIKLFNNGGTTWSKFSTFVCLNNNDKNFYLRGNDVKLNMAIKPSDSINVEIFIPSSRVQKGKYTSVWQLRNEDNEYFGDQVTLNISVYTKEEKKISENKIKLLEPIVAVEIKYDDYIITEKKLTEEKERISLSKLEKWRPRMDLMKSVYSLEGMADVRILSAIEKANGDLDLAVNYLFI